MISFKKMTVRIIFVTLAAVVANVIALAVSKAFIGVPDTFSPFWYSSVVELTAGGAIAAGAVYYAIALIWKKKLPARSANTDYTWLAVALLVLSFIPDAYLPFSGDPDNRGATWPAVIALMAMHVIPAAIAVLGFVQATDATPEHPAS